MSGTGCNGPEERRRGARQVEQRGLAIWPRSHLRMFRFGRFNNCCGASCAFCVTPRRGCSFALPTLPRPVAEESHLAESQRRGARQVDQARFILLEPAGTCGCFGVVVCQSSVVQHACKCHHGEALPFIGNRLQWSGGAASWCTAGRAAGSGQLAPHPPVDVSFW